MEEGGVFFASLRVVLFSYLDVCNPSSTHTHTHTHTHEHVQDPVKWVSGIMAAGASLKATVKKDESDAILCSLVRVFHTQGLLDNLVHPLLVQEVTGLEDPALYFRATSPSVRCLSIVCFLFGAPYLRKLLLPAINRVRLVAMNAMGASPTSAGTVGGLPHEVDPAKESDPDARMQAAQLIRDVCDDVLVTVSNSTRSSPQEFKQVCALLSAVVRARAADSPACYSGLLNFFFVRFLCPAIAMPQLQGLWEGDEPVSKPLARLLVHISGLLQKAASMTLYGKDSHMMMFNQWLTTAAFPRVSKIYTKLSAPPTVKPFDAPDTQLTAEVVTALEMELQTISTFVAADPSTASKMA
jgi:hypothetical protein